MSDKTGGSARCSKCSEPAYRKQGNQSLCAKHYRFGQIRATAKRRGKAVPTQEELEALIRHPFNCFDCRISMSWVRIAGDIAVATFQHYRDGSFGFVCRSCNTRHAYMQADTYRDMPKDHKLCPKCQQIKPRYEFSLDNGRSGELKSKSHCKECSDKATKLWKEANRERYNEYQRSYRQKRKSENVGA